jgi:uncharacterized damage-inducible protein DinB
MSANLQQALARLHAERAHLLWELVGIDGALLSSAPLNNGEWRVKDLFPHIAKCDAFEAQRLAMIRDGRTHEIESADVEAQNALWFKQYQALPLDLGVAMFLKERNGFLNVVKEISPFDFHHEVTLGFGRTITLASELDMVARHDADHTVEVTRWKNNVGLSRRKTGPRSILVAAYRASGRALRALIDMIPPDERETRPIHGTWTLKQLLAHIAAWDQYAIEGLKLGEWPPTPVGVSDILSFNEHSVALRQSWSWEMVSGEFIGARQELVGVLEQMGQGELETEFYDERRQRTFYDWLVIWLHHELMHSAELRVALNLPDTPEHLKHVEQ